MDLQGPAESVWSGYQGKWFGECLGQDGGSCWAPCGNGPPYRSPDGIVLHYLAPLQSDVSYSDCSSDGPHCHEGLRSRVHEACPAWSYLSHLAAFFFKKIRVATLRANPSSCPRHRPPRVRTSKNTVFCGTKCTCSRS